MPPYTPCEICRKPEIAGWVICPLCGGHFCFTHCVGVGESRAHAHPLTEPPPDATDVFYPWWWGRLATVMWDEAVICLANERERPRFLLSGPKTVYSFEEYGYRIGFNFGIQSHCDYGAAATLGQLIRGMPTGQRDRLFELLQDLRESKYNPTLFYQYIRDEEAHV